MRLDMDTLRGMKIKLWIMNFRSIEDQKIELAPITVVYGPNGAGKSSLLYALLTLENIVSNPNQEPDGFFKYNSFINLGSFDAVVFDHQTHNKITLGIRLEKDGIFPAYNVTYEVDIEENKGKLIATIEINDTTVVDMPLPVSFPFQMDQQIQKSISYNQRTFVVTWNGITAQVQTDSQDQEALDEASRLTTSLNAPIEMLRKVDIVPLKRGFSEPHYPFKPAFQTMISENEVATLLSDKKHLESKVSFYLEQIFERDFRVHFKPGTNTFSLDAMDKKTGVTSELVNEGFGVNQIVYLLAKSLHPDIDWICIEEPEIHLHPTAVRGVAKALVQIIRNEGKRFVISTHSESFLSALLTLVAKGELNPSDLACYLARKEKRSTQFERQQVNEKGQIEGGLASFIEAELEDIKAFLKVTK